MSAMLDWVAATPNGWEHVFHGMVQALKEGSRNELDEEFAPLG